MGNATSTEFTVIFNYAERQLPVAKANLAEADIPYEIVKQEWIYQDKSRARVTFRANSKSDAKKLREAIPVQRGLLCGCFVAAEYSENTRLETLEFKKRALELGYPKYGVDIVRNRMLHWGDDIDWKTVTRDELEALSSFSKYRKGIDIIMGVQQGKKYDKKPTWRNATQKWDGEKGEVKDKVYYIAEKLGVPKGYLHMILNVEEVTLRKWSYNPANVSHATSEMIFKRIAYMDLMRLKIRKASDERVKDLAWDSKEQKWLWPPSATDYKWVITSAYQGTVETRDFWKVASAMLCRVEKWESKKVLNYDDDAVNAVRNGRKPKYGHGIGYSRIARDKSLEMPPGVTQWTESLVGKQSV